MAANGRDQLGCVDRDALWHHIRDRWGTDCHSADVRWPETWERHIPVHRAAAAYGLGLGLYRVLDNQVLDPIVTIDHIKKRDTFSRDFQ